MLRKSINHLPLILICLTAGLAAWLVGYSTTWGPWAGSDSALYLVTAQNIVEGAGFAIDLPSGEQAYFMAPLYSLALAGLGALNIPLLSAARGLGAALFALTILGAGTGFYYLSHSKWLAVPFSALLGAFPVMLKSYSALMTEPLFLFFMMLALFALTAFLANGSRGWLVSAAVLAGLATLVRLIGVALVPVGMAAILLLQTKPWKRRGSEALLYAALFSLPVIIWIAWLATKPVASPVDAPQWSSAWDYLEPVRAGLVDTLWEWAPVQMFLPLQRYLVKLLALLAFAAVLLGLPLMASARLYGRRWKNWATDRDNQLFGVFGLFVAGYLGAFIFIYLFRLPTQDVNERTLLPFYPGMVGLFYAAGSLLQRACTGTPQRAGVRALARGLPWLGMALGLAFYAPQSAAIAREYHQHGAGYSSPAWQSSQTIQAVAQLPEDVPIISNEAGAIFFYTRRFALEISELYAVGTGTENPSTRYGDDPTDPNQQLFREQGAALVLFQPGFYWQLHQIYAEGAGERQEAFVQGLTIAGEYPDGAIYFYPTQK